VFDRDLKRLRDLVRKHRYVVTLSADDALDESDLTIFDLESSVLTGRIIQRRQDSVTGEWTYGVRGKDVDGRPIDVVVTIERQRRAAFIAAYLL